VWGREKVKRVGRVALIVCGAMVLAFTGFVAKEMFVPAPVLGGSAAPNFSSEAVARGEYLAKIGNCAGCHSMRGAEPFAGGRRIQTPFGSVVAGNITPDKTYGIGTWSADDFYRALHDGRNKDGRLLSPAFPFTNTTHISRADSDAMFAYFMRAVAASSRPNEIGNMSWLYNSQLAIAIWRVLFFDRAASIDEAPSKPAERGEYLANGIAHCSACHGARNVLGAPIGGRDYAGSMMPLNDWYAPSLHLRDEGSVADWTIEEIITWLRVGINQKASALGPMADVVFKSTQFLDDNDANALALYLKSLPVNQTSQASKAEKANTNTSSRGGELYATHCESCHGKNGEGQRGAFPSLAGNRAVTMARHESLIRITLEGGFAPGTAGNPAPYGMTPFYHLLKDEEIAEVLTYIRSAWGNDAPPVTRLDMANYRNKQRFKQ
jgi:mono/diheme cytochrome c family protein